MKRFDRPALIAVVLCASPLDSWADEPGAEATASEPGSGRRGFTFEATLGGGFQYRTADGTTQGGIFGPTFGVGWFITKDLAVLGRVMHSMVWEDDDFRTVAGAGGVVAQYWLGDQVRLEAGPGIGWGRRVGVEDFTDDWGFGLLTGVGVAVWQNRQHALTVGVEYAPAFLEDVTLHSVGGVVGWQLK
jgi:hypothetical protein